MLPAARLPLGLGLDDPNLAPSDFGWGATGGLLLHFHRASCGLGPTCNEMSFKHTPSKVCWYTAFPTAFPGGGSEASCL